MPQMPILQSPELLNCIILILNFPDSKCSILSTDKKAAPNTMANKLHSAPPFRAEQMGSLLRPDNLLEIREKIANTGISEEEAGLPPVEQEAVRDVVKMQQELGFKAVTSGEYNRTRFWGLMWDEFEGKKTHSPDQSKKN